MSVQCDANRYQLPRGSWADWRRVGDLTQQTVDTDTEEWSGEESIRASRHNSSTRIG